MRRPQKARRATESLPDTVLDEAIEIPRSETKYWLLLTDDQVELLARGIVSGETAQRAWNMLEWKRLQQRACVEALEEHEEKNFARTGEPELIQPSQLPRQP